MGVFSKDSSPAVTPNRNTVDRSKQVNGTYDYGLLYPFYCSEVLPGDSAKIDIAFGLRALPTAFPVQTKVRVDAHMFYVRNRTLFKGFQDFFSKTGSATDQTLPFISKSTLLKSLKTGSLFDYMGLPTTYLHNSEVAPLVLQTNTDPISHMSINLSSFPNTSVNWSVGGTLQPRILENGVNFHVFKLKSTDGNTFQFKAGRKYTFTINFTYTSDHSQDATWFNDSVNLYSSFFYSALGQLFEVGYNDQKKVFQMDSITSANNQSSDEVDVTVVLSCLSDITFSSEEPLYLCIFRVSDHSLEPCGFSLYNQLYSDVIYSIPNSFTDVPASYISQLPPINALPFRAYEAIYNSFYRDNRNNPHMIDGVFKPNQYVTTLEGGEDKTDYHLFRRNWEQDYLTSAVPSPQQGTAPLVGISSTGVATFADEDGVQHTVKLQVAEDGDTVTGATYTDNVPNSVARSIVNMATSGFSISDFRGVNALTRWLEINMRRGMRFKDVVESHFGKSPSYEELDMPEFLGGFTKVFDSSQVNQTIESEGSPLGSYAGQLSAVGGTAHTINRYFDEPGMVIGILSITPVPCYTQSIPKFFLKRELLDFYFPEFGHIGFQPIPYSEVSPYQALGHGMKLSDVYGYQRAWYDYLSDYDTAHGNFRDFLRDFVIYRSFDTPPSLRPEFLTVNSNQINNVFTVNPTEYHLDPFLGQIHIKSIWKRPIPLYGVPKLEFDS